MHLPQIDRRTLLAFGGAALVQPTFASAYRAPSDPSLERIIRHHVHSRGGKAALDAIRHTNSSMNLTEDGRTIQGGYIASTDGFVRVDIFSHGVRVYSEGVDAQGGWNWNGDAASPSPEGEEGTKNLRRSIELNLFGLHRFAERGHQLKLIGREIVDGVRYFVIEVRMRDGSVNNFYINPTSWLIDRSRSQRTFHPDLDPKKSWIESRFSAFRKVQGISVSTHGEEFDLLKKEVVQTTTSTGVTFNQPFDPAVFSRHFPNAGSLKALGVPVEG